MRSVRGDEEGSVLLLSLGYAVLALALILGCVDATATGECGGLRAVGHAQLVVEGVHVLLHC